MEPQLPTPFGGPERTNNEKFGKPVEHTGGESQPLIQEQAPFSSPEKANNSEVSGNSSRGGDPLWQASIVAQTAAQPNTNDVANAATKTQDDNPLTANDDDLIEKEWVIRAKKIVADTKNDPYLQEQEVSKLQADYLHKRYGREVKFSD